MQLRCLRAVLRCNIHRWMPVHLQVMNSHTLAWRPSPGTPCRRGEDVELQIPSPASCIAMHRRDEHLYGDFAKGDDLIDLAVPLEELFEELPQMLASVPCVSACVSWCSSLCR